MRFLLFLGFLLFASSAFAHTGIGSTSGFMHGITHPFGGIDHLLAMVAVGVFAAHLGGRAVWLVPSAFVFMMTVGGALGSSGVAVPFVELGIAMSVIVLGLAVALQLQVPTVLAMATVGLFAVFHGHAHGSEMPESAAGITYAMGFTAATASLHLVGLALGRSFIAAAGRPRRLAQIGGSIMSFLGVGILVGLIG